MYSGTDYLKNNSSVRFYAGNSTPNSAPFIVTDDGSIYATKGKIGGWNMDDEYFYTTYNKLKTGIHASNNNGIESHSGLGYVRFYTGLPTTTEDLKNANCYIVDNGDIKCANLWATNGIDISNGKNIEMSGSNGKIILPYWTQTSNGTAYSY